MKNEHIHNQNHSINPDADGPYRRVLSGLAYMVSVAGKISGTAVFLCTGGGVPSYKKSKEILMLFKENEERAFRELFNSFYDNLLLYAIQFYIYNPVLCWRAYLYMGKSEREEKVFYIHWNIYLLAGYGNGTCSSGRGV